jgi:outer membrane protein
VNTPSWWRAVLGGAGLVCLALAGVASAAAPSPAVKIGVVDVQQVLNQSQRGMAAKQRLEQERNARQKELDARQQELQKLQQDMEKQASVLSEQAKREKRELLERRVRDVRRIAEDANREMEKRVREAEVEVTREIFGVIQEYGKDQAYTAILERSNIVFATQAIDITPEIVKRFDAKAK